MPTLSALQKKKESLTFRGWIIYYLTTSPCSSLLVSLTSTYTLTRPLSPSSLGHWSNSLRMTQRRYSLSSSFFLPFLSIPQPEHARCLGTGFLSLLTQVRGCNPWPGNESLSQYVLPPHLINPYLVQTLCGC